MNRLKNIICEYNLKKMEDIKELRNLMSNIEIHRHQRSNNIKCEPNDFWTALSLNFFKDVLKVIGEDKNIKLSYNNIFDLDFLTNYCNENRKNSKLLENTFSARLIGLNPRSKIPSDESNCRNKIAYYKLIMDKYIEKAKISSKYINYANDYEYLVEYNKLKDVFKIIYLEETINVDSFERCLKIKDCIIKERLIEKGSLEMAYIMTY